MKLYLLQHGESNPEDVDPSKNLSEKGKADLEKVSLFLQKNSVNIPQFWHSGKARAEQSARIIAAAMQPVPQITEQVGLQPNDSPLNLVPLILEEEDDLMMVGHMPNLSKLASFLLSNTEEADFIGFQQGGVLCLEQRDQQWHLNWMVIPEII